MSERPEPPSYGVLERRQVSDDVDAHVEELEVLGFTVLEACLDARRCQALRDGIDAGNQARTATAVGVAFKADEDILRCPLADDERFLEAAILPRLLEVCRRVLGDNLVLLQQNAIVNRPDSTQHQSRWHRDLPYQHFISSRSLALNALICVDDFKAVNGATMVLPASHKCELFPSAGFVARHELAVEAAAGSVIMMDAMLFHRAGANLSRAARHGLNHLIGRPMLAQQINMPGMLGGRYAEDADLAAYLGYRWNPVATDQWRSQRSQD